MKTINVDDFLNLLKADTKMDLTYTQKAVIRSVVSDYADKYGLEVAQKQFENEENPKTCLRECYTCKNSSFESYYAREHNRMRCNLTEEEHDYRDCCNDWECKE